MRADQDITFGVTGQSLYLDAAEGRPTSVTSVQVFRWNEGDTSTAEGATTGSAAVETDPNTTTDAAAGIGQTDTRLVPLTATTGAAAGRSYLLTSAVGLSEWVEVSDVTSGASVTARHPLHNAYASGASFVSTRMSIGIDSTWVADQDNLDDTGGASGAYRVRWVYVVGGATYVRDTYFSLVRYGGAHGVRPQDIDVMVPGWMDRLPIDHRADQGRRLIDDAHRGVKMDLLRLGVADETIANADVVDELVRYKTVYMSEWSRYLAGMASDQQRVDSAKLAYTEQLDGTVRVVANVPKRDTAGAAAVDTARGFTRR